VRESHQSAARTDSGTAVAHAQAHLIVDGLTVAEEAWAGTRLGVPLARGTPSSQLLAGLMADDPPTSPGYVAFPYAHSVVVGGGRVRNACPYVAAHGLSA
jgi:hypothetical protein